MLNVARQLSEQFTLKYCATGLEIAQCQLEVVKSASLTLELFRQSS